MPERSTWAYSSFFTEATLEIVRKTTCDFVDALKDSIAPVMGSGGDTMKLHRLAHVHDFW
eukprot:355039-Chlamydomonas_euryale.AAC.15